MRLPKYSYVYAGLLLLGVIGGYIYWYQWGCTDSCPIDSSWKWSVARGGLIGLCFAAIIQPKKRKKKEEIDQDQSES